MAAAEGGRRPWEPRRRAGGCGGRGMLRGCWWRGLRASFRPARELGGDSCRAQGSAVQVRGRGTEAEESAWHRWWLERSSWWLSTPRAAAAALAAAAGQARRAFPGGYLAFGSPRGSSQNLILARYRSRRPTRFHRRQPPLQTHRRDAGGLQADPARRGHPPGSGAGRQRGVRVGGEGGEGGEGAATSHTIHDLPCSLDLLTDLATRPAPHLAASGSGTAPAAHGPSGPQRAGSLRQPRRRRRCRWRCLQQLGHHQRRAVGHPERAVGCWCQQLQRLAAQRSTLSHRQRRRQQQRQAVRCHSDAGWRSAAHGGAARVGCTPPGGLPIPLSPADRRRRRQWRQPRWQWRHDQQRQQQQRRQQLHGGGRRSGRQPRALHCAAGCRHATQAAGDR